MPSYVRTRTFCCCLPVRLGVFLLSLLALAGGAFLAVFGWIQLSQLKQHPLGKIDEISLWIQSSLFSLLAVLAIFGFFGAMIKNRGMVSGFAIAIAIHLGFSIAAGCFSIYAMFARDSQAALDSCLQIANDDSDATMQSCKKGLIIIKAVTVVIYVLIWFIQLYAYFVVERYVDQLDEERLFENPIVLPRTMVMQVGGPQVTTYNGFAPTYPFTDPRHALGATGHGQPPNYTA
jgi:hypothetical protein